VLTYRVLDWWSAVHGGEPAPRDTFPGMGDYMLDFMGDSYGDVLDTAGMSPPPLVAMPEPGACGWRVHPDDTQLPAWLRSLVDWHVRPSASPWAAGAMARVACAHVDWELVWIQAPELWDRRAQIGIPDLPVLWSARQSLAELGHELIIEVQLEELDGELGLAVYGAGVAGLLGDRAWRAVAPLLTTCVATIREPRSDYLASLRTDPLMPAVVEPRAHTGRPAPGTTTPHAWLAGAWVHTWWAYPMQGQLRESCACPGHRPGVAAEQFGPTGTSGRSA
jgi:hypothetical protein